jgi:hypothetical protein
MFSPWKFFKDYKQNMKTKDVQKPHLAPWHVTTSLSNTLTDNLWDHIYDFLEF